MTRSQLHQRKIQGYCFLSIHLKIKLHQTHYSKIMTGAEKKLTSHASIIE